MVQEKFGDNGQGCACEPLMNEASPSIYANNPFVFFHLPASASDRDIKKAIQHYSLLHRTEPKVQSSKTEAALQAIDRLPEFELRLLNPETRLINEFFHFSTNTEAKTNLFNKIAIVVKGRDPVKSILLWMKLEKAIRNPLVHLHDMAVLSHRLALCVEETPLEDSIKQTLREFFWKKTYTLWNRCGQCEEVWNTLRERVRSYQDPRLTTGFVRRFRETLPTALYAIHWNLLIGYCKKKCQDDVQWHRDFLNASEVEPQVLENAFQFAGKLVIDRIEHFCSQLTANALSVGDWSDRLESAYQQVLDSLQVARNIQPEDLPLRVKLLDEAAQSIFQYVMPLCNREENYRVVLQWLNAADSLAVSPLLRERICNNRDSIQLHLERKPCWFCDDFLSSDSSTLIRVMQPRILNFHRYRRGAQPEVLEIPRCPRCQTVHERQRALRRWSSIGGFLLGASLLYPLSFFAPVANNWISLALLGVATAATGAQSLRNLGRRMIPKGIRPESDCLRHPSAETIMDTWRAGAAPLEQIQEKL